MTKSTVNFSVSLEESCGILCSLHNFTPSIFYKLKEKCSDFIVKEINLKGNVVDVDVPNQLPVLNDPNKDEMSDVIFTLTTELIIKQLVNATPQNCFTQSSLDQVFEFLKDNSRSQIIIEQDFLDKATRSAIHQAFKFLLPSNIVTDTVDQRLIRLSRKGTNASYDMRNNQPSKNSHPTYLQFVMRKEGLDTGDAIATIARKLHLPLKALSFAGSKDRKAVTEQQVVARHCDARKLLGFNKIPGTGIRIGAIQPCDRQLSLGALTGNRFIITLKQVERESIPELKRRVEALSERGFVNFYGPQRFGAHGRTTLVGKALLKGKWEEACHAILDPKNNLEDEERGVGEAPLISAARQLWKEGKLQESLDSFPRFCHAERHLLGHLLRAPNDWLGAIGSIPREMRMLYLHAVQSYLWNRLASSKISSMNDKELSMTLPLIGYESGANVECYKSLLEEQGLSIENFKPTPQTENLWDLKGEDKRALIVKPDNLKVCFDEGGDDFAKIIVKVSFGLPASSYATVLLRELFGAFQ